MSYGPLPGDAPATREPVEPRDSVRPSDRAAGRVAPPWFRSLVWAGLATYWFVMAVAHDSGAWRWADVGLGVGGMILALDDARRRIGERNMARQTERSG